MTAHPRFASFNFQDWIDRNRDSLKPPVSNKQLFDEKTGMIVMIVGGPNKRVDFHDDPVEEFFYQLKGAAVKYWYYDYSTITALGLPAASRNRTEYVEALTLGYEILEGINIFISPGLNQRIYADTVNIANQQRDSTGYNMNLGGSVTIGKRTSLDAAIGYTSQAYLSDGSTTTAGTFSLGGTWNGYEPLILRPAISRSINGSALTNYQNYVSTVIGVDWIYQVHCAWKMIGGLL